MSLTPAPNKLPGDDLQQTLDRMMERIDQPQVLQLPDYEKQAVRQVIQRVRTQWMDGPQPSLTIALAGGTGVGKSTLTNAFAGAPIAESSEIRPTTTRIRVYHHRDLPDGNLPVEIGRDAHFVAHDRTPLRWKVIVDTPDLDSLATEHRETTKKLLKAAGLVLYVFSPERYADERVWSVIRGETEFSSTAAVLNRVDHGVSRDDVEDITKDLKEKFAHLGLPNVRVFRTVARAHLPGVDAAKLPNSSGIDETQELLQFVEEELQSSDIMQMVRSKQQAIVKHLRKELDRVAPLDLPKRLEKVESKLQTASTEAANELTSLVSISLDAVESELAAVATLRQHERFRGPFRSWLVVMDFFRYGLAGLIDRLMGRPQRGDLQVLEHLFARNSGPEVEDILSEVRQSIGDALYALKLPVEGWRDLSSQTDSARLMRRVATEIQARFDARLHEDRKRGKWMVWTANLLGSLVPGAFVIGGLYVMTQGLINAEYIGLGLLGHLAAMVVLFFLALQGLVAICMPSVSGLGQGLGRQAIREVVQHSLATWLQTYRERLRSDLHALREPLLALEARLKELDSPTPAAEASEQLPEPVAEK